MKKIFNILMSLLIVFVLSFGLVACKKESTKYPNTNYEKVQYAFNGVESSLSNSTSQKVSKESTTNTKPTPMAKDNNDPIEVIYSAMDVISETSNPSFDYDEPPMIQFQYLKAVFEEIGEDFSFGTKYTYNLTGEVYYDFSSRVVKEEEKYLNQYSFDLSVEINIDASDLIKAMVGFDITYTNKDIKRHQIRYAELILDYNMHESKPTYTLTMYDMDDLSNFPYQEELYSSGEYDYVQVENNKINEWRKFGMAGRPVFAFPEDPMPYSPYKYTVLRGYKDNKLYKLSNEFIKDDLLKGAVIDGLGLNEVASRMDAYIGKAGTSNEKIKTIYNKFNNILGKDIAYSFVYTGATEKWEGEPVGYDNLLLSVVSSAYVTDTIYEDYSLIDLFDPYSNVYFNNSAKHEFLTIFLKSDVDEVFGVYNDFDNVNVKVRSTSYDKTKWIDVNGLEDKPFSYFINESGYVTENLSSETEPMKLEFSITLKNHPNVTLQETFYVTLINKDAYNNVIGDWDKIDNYLNEYLLFKGEIPEFSSSRIIKYCASVNEDGLSGYFGYDSSDISSDEAKYKEKLVSLGFTENKDYSIYKKRINDDYILKLTVLDYSTTFEFIYSKEHVSLTVALNKLIDNKDIVIPEFPYDYEYTVDNNIIRIDNKEGSYISEYINLFSDYGFIVGTQDDFTVAYKYLDGILYRVRDLGYSIAIEKVKFTLSIIGDHNNWDATDNSFDLKVISIDGDVYIRGLVVIKENESIKIVKNHSWNAGEYGFNLFSGDATFDPKLFTTGADDTITVLAGGLYGVTVRLGLSMSSPNINENEAIPLMISVEDKTIRITKPLTIYTGTDLIVKDVEVGSDITDILESLNLKMEGYRISEYSVKLPYIMPDEEVTVRVIWEKEEYKLTVNLDDSTTIEVLVPYDSYIGSYVNTKEGYRFVSDYDGTSMPSHDLTITGRFEKLYHYQVIYGLNNGIKEDIDTYFIENEVIPDRFKIDFNYNYGKKGYDYIGYEGYEEVDVMPNHDICVVFKYEPHTYNVTFDSEYLDYIEFTTTSVKYDGKLTLPEVRINKEGFTFEGWYLVDGNTTYSEKVDPESWSFDPTNRDVVLKSKWSIGYIEEKVNYFDYGMYPQTHVSDASLIEILNSLTTPNELGYYEYNGSMYAKINATPAGRNMTYSDGSIIEEGEAWFKVEPIKWKVVKNGFLTYGLQLAKLIDTCIYSSNKINYSDSYLRYFLNTTFKDQAFCYETSGTIPVTSILCTEIYYETDGETIKIGPVVTKSVHEYIHVPGGIAFGGFEKMELTDYALARGASCTKVTYKSGEVKYYGKIWIQEQSYETSINFYKPAYHTYNDKLEIEDSRSLGVAFVCTFSLSFIENDSE